MPHKKTLLIIEDDEEIRSTLKSLVEMTYPQINVETGVCGAAGLDILRHKHVDFYFLDWFMHPLNGQDFLKALKTEPELAKIPYVIMSAATKSELDSLSQHVRVLRKPFEFDEFFAIIKEKLNL